MVPSEKQKSPLRFRSEKTPIPNFEFGLGSVESLACGTPAVVWGDGAAPTEQIINRINGFHARPYDLKDFAAKLDKSIETDFKSKNRKEILESAKKFSYTEVKKDFIKNIKKVLASSP